MNVKSRRIEYKGNTIYYIAHGPSIHAGKLEGPGEVVTGQDRLERFSSEQDWRDRLIELGYQPGEDVDERAGYETIDEFHAP